MSESSHDIGPLAQRGHPNPFYSYSPSGGVDSSMSPHELPSSESERAEVYQDKSSNRSPHWDQTGSVET